MEKQKNIFDRAQHILRVVISVVSLVVVGAIVIDYGFELDEPDEMLAERFATTEVEEELE